jgi:hypothetical protein
MSSKWVNIAPQTSIQLRPGYLGQEKIKVIPDSVLVYGAKSILDTLKKIQTLDFKASDVHKVIDQKISFKSISGLKFENNQTRLYWPVLQYSEKTLKITIKIINLPSGVKIKLFPPQVSLRVTLPLSLVSTLEEADFLIAVDYNDIENKPSVLELKLLKQPTSVKKTIWDPKSVNYLIRK